MSKMKDQTYFSKDWLTHPDLLILMIILLLVVRLVIKHFSYGKESLISHASGKSHKKHFDRN